MNELQKTLRLLTRNTVGLFGLIGVLVIVAVSFIGPLVVPPADTADVANIYSGPSAKHILGTDFQGRDNFVQLIYGGKDIVIIAVIAGVLTVLIAVLIGSVAAFMGGKVDSVLREVINVWLTIPQFPLLAILATLLKLSDVSLLSVIIAVLSWPSLALQVRAQMLSLRKRDYVEAATLLDLGTPHIILREMLPNIAPFIAISLIFAMTSAIYQQTGLVFLGLVPFSSANWGVTISLAYAKGAHFQSDSSWSLLVPVAAIVLFQLALVSLSRSMEEVFNPRLRTEV
jgi:peptide/nickel transport system permease protein